MSEKTKKILLEIIKDLSFFVLFFVLNFAGIKNIIFPFAFGMFYALIWCNQKIYILSPLYILASFLAHLDYNSVIISSVTVLVILIAYLIHYKLKKPMRPYLISIYALISQSVYVWISVVSGVSIIAIILTLIIGLFFLFACISFLSAVFTRGITMRLKVIEIICGCSILMATACGLNSFSFFQFEVVKLVSCLIILFSAYCFNISFALVISTVLGLGTLLNASNPLYIAPFVSWALVICGFKFGKRYIPALGVLAIEAMIGWYFELYYSYTIISFLPCLIACLIFVCAPQNLIKIINSIFTSSSENIAMRNIVNRNRESLARRFNDLSDVFGEMDRVFRMMIKGGLSIEQAKSLLFNEIKEKLCVQCPERNKCHRIYERETESVFSELISLALERNRITLLDIPPFITGKCGKINSLVGIINDITDQYKQYASVMNNLDASRVLIAEQLTGVCKIMRNLADEVGKNVIFDNSRENRIMDELIYNNIICSEALIYEQNPNILNVSLVVKSEDCNRISLPKIVSKVLGYQMSVSNVNSAAIGGWSVLELKNSPKFDVVFGTAGCAKTTNSISGDCYSLTRIENDKFMMALCDGMGNGKKAENASALAVGLLENFYKAGFDNEIILSSVNNLLSLGNGEDMFSALDIAVLDLKNGIADFIKLGATIGFVKHISHISKIKCESLPIGIVREMKPSVQKIVLSAGDIVILCTDGVSDSFANENDMFDFIGSITTVNPQVIAEEILSKALQNNGGTARDDMTVLIARIYEKV